MLRRRLIVKRETRVFFLLALLIFLMIRMFMLIEHNLRPTILRSAGIRANYIATEAVNKAILENVAQDVDYQDLILLVKDNSGRIVFSQVNNVTISGIIAATNLHAQEALKTVAREKISIPFGQVFNSYLLANVGPRIPVKISPRGVINTNLIDKFESAGINQVRHKIYLEVQAEMQVVIPLMADKINVSTTILLVDAIYPGEVPNTVIDLQYPLSGQHE
ncbi:MAG TPA: sporulation protein YunB [Oscillospiraceae bacterium]|nr:sporulation protein YunB [Oscillospiraceae bacterium]